MSREEGRPDGDLEHVLEYTCTFGYPTGEGIRVLYIEVEHPVNQRQVAQSAGPQAWADARKAAWWLDGLVLHIVGWTKVQTGPDPEDPRGKGLPPEYEWRWVDLYLPWAHTNILEVTRNDGWPIPEEEA